MSTAWHRHSFALFAIVAMLALASMSGCSSSRAAKGAGIGAVAGGVAGAVIGHQSGHKTEGAVIGAAAGAAIGGVIGHRLDQQAAELAKVAETRRTEQGVLVNLSSNTIHFATNSSLVSDDSRGTLVELGDILKKYPEDMIMISGHTDSDGAAEYNQRLSEMRAQAVADILIQTGVPSESISVYGYGETQPLAANDTPEDKALNRRVELAITVDESKVPQE